MQHYLTLCAENFCLNKPLLDQDMSLKAKWSTNYDSACIYSTICWAVLVGVGQAYYSPHVYSVFK